MMTMFTLKKLALLLITNALLLTSYTASAVTTSISDIIIGSSTGAYTQVSVLVDSNECQGDLFTKTKGDCVISLGGVTLEDGELLVKFDYQTQITDQNFIYTQNTDSSIGSWTSTPNTIYPNIYFWVAKATSGLILNWVVPTSITGSVCYGPLTYDCLNAAQSVTTGTWVTPSNGGGLAALSHLTFYGGDQQPDPSVKVPEPETLTLFAIALVGLSLQRKRKSV